MQGLDLFWFYQPEENVLNITVSENLLQVVKPEDA
jgi:hypothetical protein